MADAKKDFEFEPALAELETLVGTLEGGQLSLEDSLAAFERGIALTRQCQQALASAEQRVEMLVEQNGTSQAVPFQQDNGAE